MVPLVAYLLAAFGFSYVIGHAQISLPARMWIQDNTFGRMQEWTLGLLECCACSGSHVGFWWGMFLGLPGVVVPGWRGAVFMAFMTCGSNFVLSVLTGLTEKDDVQVGGADE